MERIAGPARYRKNFSQVFPAFVRSELTPYPGRSATVARITLAVTITFILVSTFRIPASAITLYMVFTVTRDTPTRPSRAHL